MVYTVTVTHDVTICHTIVTMWQSHMILSRTPSYSYKFNKKRNINNDLAILPSHDKKLAKGAHWALETQKRLFTLPGYAKGFESVFAKKNFDILLEHRQWDHAIELVPGLEPKSLKVYPLSPVEQKELDSYLEENLHSRWIHPSKSPMAAPVFFTKKKDSSLWLVQDYHILNSMMVKNKYPLPLISKLVSQLRRAKYFTKLDVRCYDLKE